MRLSVISNKTCRFLRRAGRGVGVASLRGVPEYKVGSVEEGCTRTDGFGVVDRDVAYQVSATAEEGMGNLRRRVSSNGVLSLIFCIDTGCLKSHLTRITGAFAFTVDAGTLERELQGIHYP